jgi:hypothetical protein
MQLVRIPEAYVRALADIYQRTEAQIDVDPHKSKKLSVFIYNADYDWKTFGIAAQYNESWPEETARFGYPIHDVRLESFLMPKALERVWRDSKRVAPLNVAVPDVPEAYARGELSSRGSLGPVVFEGAYQLM